MRLASGRKSDVSRARMALPTHFGLAWLSQHILDLWTTPKCVLDEVEKAIILVVECHLGVIFCFLTNRKCDFFQVDKATIQVVVWHLKVIFCLLTRPNFDIVEVAEKMFQKMFRQALGIYFLLLTSPKCNLCEVEKAMFQGVA